MRSYGVRVFRLVLVAVLRKDETESVLANVEGCNSDSESSESRCSGCGKLLPVYPAWYLLLYVCMYVCIQTSCYFICILHWFPCQTLGWGSALLGPGQHQARVTQTIEMELLISLTVGLNTGLRGWTKQDTNAISACDESHLWFRTRKTFLNSHRNNCGTWHFSLKGSILIPSLQVGDQSLSAVCHSFNIFAVAFRIPYCVSRSPL